jgi:hypothetical protein
MATVYTPGVAGTVLSGMIGSNPWAVAHHWQFGTSTAAWSQSNLDLLAQTIYTAATANFIPFMGNNVDTRQVTSTDLGSSTGLGSLYTHSPTVGLLGTPLEPSSLCMVIQNRIASRYRGGHPRTYYPLYTQQYMATENTWQPANVATAATKVVAFVSAVISAAYSGSPGALQHVIPRYLYSHTDDPVHHKYTKTRIGLEGVHVVNSYFGNGRVGSQRRRLSP